MWLNRHLRGAFCTALFVLACLHAGAEESAFSYSSNFLNHVDILVPGYTSVTEELTNMPILIRLAEDSPRGFSYKDAGETLENHWMRFWATDPDGTNGRWVPHEVEAWNDTGTTYVWVRIPRLSGDSRQKIILYWANNPTDPLPASQANDSAEVWTNYVGVWHMNREYESTSNHMTSVLGPHASFMDATPLGGAAGCDASGNNGPIMVATQCDALNAITNDNCASGFTASITLYMNTSDQDYAYLFGRRSSDKTDAYAVQFAGTEGTCDKVRTWHNSGDFETFSPKPSAQQWVRLDIEYMPTYMHVWLNGKCVGWDDNPAETEYRNGELDLAIGGLLADPLTGLYNRGTLDGYVDEFRIRPGPIMTGLSSKAKYHNAYSPRIQAEMGQSTTTYIAFTNLYKNGKVYNYWVREPKMTKTIFELGVTAEEIIACVVPGQSVAGTNVVYEFYNKKTGETTKTVPTEGGEYRLVVRIDETDKYSGAETSIDFRIVEHKPTHEVASTEEGRSARILTMNSDETDEAAAVTRQGYDDTYDNPEGITGVSYWWHDNRADRELIATEWGGEPEDYSGVEYYAGVYSWYFNFCAGTWHIHRGASGARLWDLRDIRFGNTYDVYLDPMVETQNYLPFCDTSARMEDSTAEVAGDFTAVGQAIFLNKAVDITSRTSLDGAAIYSSCYSNGIGTIYFDAVNVFTEDAGLGYNKIKVEISTNIVYWDSETKSWEESTWAPTDDVIFYRWSPDEKTEDDPTKVWYTNEYGKAKWRTIDMHVLKYGVDPDTGTNTVTDLGVCSAEDGFDLAVTEGGSNDTFYRFYVPVKYRGYIRFRIVRTTANPDYTVNPDIGGMIAVDNIVASSPTPRVLLEPYGWYDETKTGKQVLGQEIAFTTPFPSCNDTNVLGRAKGVVDGDTTLAATQMVASAELHYRWVYLNQKSTDWTVSDLVPETLVSMKKLDLPYHMPGDVEFYYTVYQNSPFYKLYDYNGRDYVVPDYTEEYTTSTNRPDEYSTSEGRDCWFVRLRDGLSNVESMTVVWKDLDEAYRTEHTIAMEVVDNHAWRGYLLTTTNQATKTIRFRFECRNTQTAGATEWEKNTNYWCYADAIKELPVTGKLDEAEPTDWKEMTFEPTTGYIMFQIDDESRAITIVHADYQNFNGWSDAHRDYFVGAVADDVPGSGVSPTAKDYTLDYRECVSSGDITEREDEGTAAYWQENFFPGNYYDYYKPFRAGITYGSGGTEGNTWALGRGMMVCPVYRDFTAYDEGGIPYGAYQMSGCGEGYMHMAHPVEDPEGIGHVSFNARIAQEVHPDYLSYLAGVDYSDQAGWSRKKSLLVARVNFGTKNNADFLGNASISLFANFRPNRGGYEARWEQIRAQTDESQEFVVGPHLKGQRLALFRWDRGSDGVMRETLLFAATNTDGSAESDFPGTTEWSTGLGAFEMPRTTAQNLNLLPFFFSVFVNNSGQPCLVSGVQGHNPLGPNDPNSNFNNNKWQYITYVDASTEGKNHQKGTYGVEVANCEGIVVRPQLGSDYNVNILSNLVKSIGGSVAANKTISDFRVSTDDFHDLSQDVLTNDEWTVHARLNVHDWENESHAGDVAWANCWGFCASPVEQTVELQMREKGETSENDWQVFGSVTLGDNYPYGRPMDQRNGTINVWTPKNYEVRLMTGGEMDGYRTDVTIDHVQITQWAGENVYGTKRKTSYDYSDWYDWCYTSGWMTDSGLLLSPKRTKEDDPCSVRSPLFDGVGERTMGLGRFYFRYKNAQPNVRLLLQFSTNVYTSTVRGLTSASDKGDGDGNGTWKTVKTYLGSDYGTSTDNTTLTNYLGTSGTETYYFGFHDVKGVMRIIVDPDLVTEMQTDPAATNTDAFGEITIVEVTARDEPSLDLGCWWGWNIRTIGDETDSEQKMFLPDPDEQPAGLSLALNNSIYDDIEPDTPPADYNKHMPFVQSPTFTNNVVGEISFRARRWDMSSEGQGQPAEVHLYGSRLGELDLVDTNWTDLATFVISNTTYATYSHKIAESSGYRAFRLAVTGVSGVKYPGPSPTKGTTPVRVLIDEIVVCEAVRATLGFRKVGVFRTGLSHNREITDILKNTQQPLTGESWGYQCTVYAAMLEDELDMTFRPKVRVYWYRGDSPWGFQKWRKKIPDSPTQNCGSAPLSMAEGYATSNMVYRSSYDSAASAVMAPENTSETVYQYALEVVYRTGTADTGYTFMTNVLDQTMWSVPDWYAPIDYNEDPEYGAGTEAGFTAYTIISDVPPGWTWINEQNVFGGFVQWENPDEKYQYIEIAAPATANLEGWRIQFLTASVGSGKCQTNTVAAFGSQIQSGKKENIVSNMVFYVLASKQSYNNKTGTPHLDASAGEVDGYWYIDKNSSYISKTTGYIEPDGVIGIQLVRPNGIIEHQVLMLGIDRWEPEEKESWERNLIFYNSTLPKAHFFYPGDDAGGMPEGGEVDHRYPYSVGVFDSRGEDETVWTNQWICTPGRLNEDGHGNYQKIAVPPEPNGENVILYARVDQSGGEIRQTVGEESNTTETQMILLRRGNATGTNITYRVKPWYEVSSVTETGDGSRPHVIPESQRVYTVNCGAYASNTITVIAKAAVDSKIRRDYGVSEKDPYFPAILSWLEGEETLKGSFAYPGGDIDLAKIYDKNDHFVTNMTLKQMYWLDMDPTVSNLALKVAMINSGEHILTNDTYVGTNTRVTVYMQMTNRTEDTMSAYYGQAWSPYVLRGLTPGYTSWDYADEPNVVWTNVNFKVTGMLLNGLTDQWVPLRYFVIMPDSFYQTNSVQVLNHSKQAYTSEIEVDDPFWPNSPGYTAWYDWFKDHTKAESPLGWGFMIDEKRAPIRAEFLKTNNLYYAEGEK